MLCSKAMQVFHEAWHQVIDSEVSAVQTITLSIDTEPPAAVVVILALVDRGDSKAIAMSTHKHIGEMMSKLYGTQVECDLTKKGN